MKRCKKVMIALDYDSNAIKIAEFGYRFAKSIDAEIVLLHINKDFKYYFITTVNEGPLVVNSSTAVKETTFKFLEKIKIHLKDADINLLQAEGSVAEMTLKLAKSLFVDVIVIGSHSKSWFENIVMGSETEKVLDKTNIPLLIIPTNKPE
ncbi:MAG: universal stress protein [Bacteroidota bacterium]